MRPALGALVLCYVFSLGISNPLRNGHGRDTGHHVNIELYNGSEPTGAANRCEDEEGFDAVTLDQNGAMNFFKENFLWKGGSSSAVFVNESYPEVEGQIDGAFRMQRKTPEQHDRIFLLKGSKAWIYTDGKLEVDSPKLIGDLFPGVPEAIDAAVECHKEECQADSVIFFKDNVIFTYDSSTDKVKQKSWPKESPITFCTAALYWLGRHYCFQGTDFYRFDPVTGEMATGTYPKDARDYFIHCPGRHHGYEAAKNATLWSIKNRCNSRPYDDFTSDDDGHVYAFRSGWFFSLDRQRDGWHAWPLSHKWKGLHGVITTAFNWENKMYFVKDSLVYIYRVGQGYRLVAGYPKPLQEELGITGEGLDAAFTCPHSSQLYIIRGNKMRSLDLQLEQKTLSEESSIPHAHIDGAMCTSKGVFLFKDGDYYQYKDTAELATVSEVPAAQSIAKDFMACNN